jgi:hypothetical protein
MWSYKLKISEFVEKLIEMKNIYGDIDIKIDNREDDWGDYNVYDIGVIEFDDVKYVKII